MMSSRKILIPAAGFGKRVGAPQSKEMFLRPQGLSLERRPLIDLALHLSEIFAAEPHVILREEKTTLIHHLRQKNVNFQSVSPTREWPHSLLLSEPYWQENNVVCLPDIDFAPWDVVGQMFEILEKDEADFVFSVFSVTDLRTWGAIRPIHTSSLSGVSESLQFYEHCEKPAEAFSLGAKAWGLFGFRQPWGRMLLESLLTSAVDHKWRKLMGRGRLVTLDYFADLTRGPESLCILENAK